uniref:Uncharacterized protein n=1 Tax=Geladintestivirus 2 TaxID=3233134 RepID=A0AAU8MIE6_9CAUD
MEQSYSAININNPLLILIGYNKYQKDFIVINEINKLCLFILVLIKGAGNNLK